MVATPDPTVPDPTVPATPDPILYQEKNVFYADMLELIRAYSVMCTRFLVVESASQAAVSPALAALPDTVTSIQAQLATDEASALAVKTKLDNLFPDPAGDTPGGSTSPAGTSPAGASSTSGPMIPPAVPSGSL